METTKRTFHTQTSKSVTVSLVLLISILSTVTHAFAPRQLVNYGNTYTFISSQQQRHRGSSPLYSSSNDSGNNDNAIDVEFVYSEDGKSPSNKQGIATSPGSSKAKTPLQASLSGIDPKLSTLSIDFVDPVTERYIPCRMAFTLTSDDVEYVIGTPIDAQVAIYCEDSEKQTSFFLDPDAEDNIEIMEMAAGVFEDKYRDVQIRFKRTPRALTVEGDLKVVTGDWRADRAKKTATVQNVAGSILEELGKTDDGQSDDDYFDSFFKSELGENYKENILIESEELDEEAKEMMELFTIPGLGSEQSDDEGIKDLLEDIFNGNDADLASSKRGADIETALRLVGFKGEDEKMYSLVQLLQPMILVAKVDPSLDPDQRMLLSPEEAEVIVPKLELEFQKELEDAGLKLKP